MKTLAANLIEKENIPWMILQPARNEKNDLICKLKKAESLGNLLKTKVSIYFNSSDGLNVVNTTIWFASEDYVCLKGGITIPTSCITDVVF
jgi:hypothetical protein